MPETGEVVVMSILLIIAGLVFIFGTGRKIYQYYSTPAPLKIPTTPAPTSRIGVVWRLTKEVLVFQSLFKAAKVTWLLSWLFHAGLLVVLLYHLQFFTDPVWSWIWLLVPVVKYASFAMVTGLTGLLVLRVVVDRVRVISAPSDYLMLVLLLSIAASGLLMRYFWYPDIVLLKQFIAGVLSLQFQSFPGGFTLFVHLLLVAVLMIIFPFSKLLHAPGLFFSPSRNQVDDSRERNLDPRAIESRSTKDVSTGAGHE